MASSTFTYIDGSGTLRNRLAEGEGTVADPDKQVVYDPDGNGLLTAISGKLPGLGSRSISQSISVSIADDQEVLITSPTYDIFNSIGTSAGSNIKANNAKIFSIGAVNANASTRFLQLFNKNSAAVAGDLPTLVYPISGNHGFMKLDVTFWGYAGLYFSAGFSWGFSTTMLSYTAGTASECVFEARYL